MEEKTSQAGQSPFESKEAEVEPVRETSQEAPMEQEASQTEAESPKTSPEPTATEKEPEAPVNSEKNDIDDNKVLAVLSYLSVLVLVPLLMKSESPFVKFHMKQGLVLLIAWAVVFVVNMFLGWFLWFILAPLSFIINVGILIFSIMGIVHVIQGKKEKLPLIGGLAEKFTF